MVFGTRRLLSQVLQGMPRRLPGSESGVCPRPEIRRDIASFFDDMLPGDNKKPAQTPEQAEAAFQNSRGYRRATQMLS